MKIGIIGAMPEEIRLLDEKLENKQGWEEAGARFISGQYAGHEVVVAESGIGKVLAAMTATLLISHYHVDILLNTGSAGGIGKGLSIGDLVVSQELAYFDADVTAAGYAPGQMPGMPLYYPADETLIQAAKQAANLAGFTVKTGLIVTGDQFVNSSDVVTQIRTLFPKTLVTEMEGAAIAQVAYQYKIPFVVVRAVSDHADEEASVTFDEFIQEAGRKSAEMTLAFVKQLEV